MPATGEPQRPGIDDDWGFAGDAIFLPLTWCRHLYYIYAATITNYRNQKPWKTDVLKASHCIFWRSKPKLTCCLSLYPHFPEHRDGAGDGNHTGLPQMQQVLEMGSIYGQCTTEEQTPLFLIRPSLK